MNERNACNVHCMYSTVHTHNSLYNVQNTRTRAIEYIFTQQSTPTEDLTMFDTDFASK